MQNDLINNIVFILKHTRFDLANEKRLHIDMRQVLSKVFPDLEYEKRLNDKNIIDFFIRGVGIEVKIKGSKRAIHKQCIRYCECDQIESLILVTGIMTGFPPEINGKDCYVLKLSQAWL